MKTQTSDPLPKTTNEALGRLAVALVAQGCKPAEIGKVLVDVLLHVATTDAGGVANAVGCPRHDVRRALHQAVRREVNLVAGSTIREERRVPSNSDGRARSEIALERIARGTGPTARLAADTLRICREGAAREQGAEKRPPG